MFSIASAVLSRKSKTWSLWNLVYFKQDINFATGHSCETIGNRTLNLEKRNGSETLILA